MTHEHRPHDHPHPQEYEHVPSDIPLAPALHVAVDDKDVVDADPWNDLWFYTNAMGFPRD